MSANRSQSIPVGAPVDLTNCDREPIHTPGAIQAHGALFALDPATLRVLSASANAPSFTGVTLERTINARSEDVFDREVIAHVQRAIAEVDATEAPLVFPISSSYVGRVHRAGDTLFLEFEPASSGEDDIAERGRAAASRLRSESDIDRLCDEAAKYVRALAGYDRVMIYRFDPDGHGSVIAESREPRLEAFLGQHYPASDIPRQARELYRTTMLRLIVDVAYVSSPLVPLADPRSGDPWDLGRAILRSVSPIHIEYLKNMGVTATLTISLMRAGELWGLIACHHYAPKYVGHNVRVATEALGRALIARIDEIEESGSDRRRTAVQSALERFVADAGSDRPQAVAADGALHRALGWDGAALVRDEAITSGKTPERERIAALAAWLDERKGDDRFITDNLAKLNPALRDLAPYASGVFAYQVAGGWLFAFRAEFKHEIVWAGDPNKAATPGEGDRLTPRGSFEKWREEVNERAIPWEPEVLAAHDRLIRWISDGSWS